MALEGVAPGWVGAFVVRPELALPAGVESLVASGSRARLTWWCRAGSVLQWRRPMSVGRRLGSVWPEAAGGSGKLVVTSII